VTTTDTIDVLHLEDGPYSTGERHLSARLFTLPTATATAALHDQGLTATVDLADSGMRLHYDPDDRGTINAPLTRLTSWNDDADPVQIHGDGVITGIDHQGQPCSLTPVQHVMLFMLLSLAASEVSEANSQPTQSS